MRGRFIVRRPRCLIWAPAAVTFAAVSATTNATTALGQIAVPAITISGPDSARASISPGEAAYHVAVVSKRLQDDVPYMQVAAKDSIRNVLVERARVWMGHVDPQLIRGLHLDPYGVVGADASRDSAAIRAIETRLATPNLTPNARAYTYLSATIAFGRAEYAGYAARLPVAERYVAALDSMGNSVANVQFIAHALLSNTYFLSGKTTEMIRHGMRAMDCLERMDFTDRGLMYSDFQSLYVDLISVLSGQPDGPAKIAKINASLVAATTPPPALAAMDESFARTGDYWHSAAQQMITLGNRVGQRAPNLLGNYWVNVPSTGATRGVDSMVVTDGTLRVVELGDLGCGPCIASLPAMQRLQDRFPAMRSVFLTATMGAWSNRLVEPDVEAEKLRETYTQSLKVRFPISIWKGEKVRTEDGGFAPKNEGPNFANYPLLGTPTFYVIDGHGRIRRVIFGQLTPDRETQLASLIDFLSKETSAVAHQ